MYLPGRRELLFAFLYFCEGAPIGFLWWALPAYWADVGVPVARVTTISALAVLPWSMKWLWAPLVDLTSRRVGYHSWIVAMQLLMGAALVPLVRLDPIDQFSWLMAALGIHAIAAATQDVAIDGLCVAMVEEHERGEVNGWMQVGMLFARALFGGGAVLLIARTSLVTAVVLLVALLWSSAYGLAMYFRPALPIAFQSDGPPGAWRLEALRVLQSRFIWLAAALALFGGAAFETVGALLGPYLEHAQWTLEQIGWFQVGPVAIAMAAGALVGGRTADRFGHVRVAWFSLLTLVLLNVLLALIGIYDRVGIPFQQLLLVCVYAVIGFYTASSYALFMDLAQGRWQATIFSALMGLTNACEAGSTLIAGRIVQSLGYSVAFGMMTVPSLVGLVVLPLLRRRNQSLGSERTSDDVDLGGTR